MKEIELTQGYVALVDDQEYERVNRFKWHVAMDYYSDGTVRNMYARRCICKPDGKDTTQPMHCFIMGAIGIDHEDHNGLNNQRYNLRSATVAQNGHNQSLSKTNTSGYKGVTWDKVGRKWRAYIKINDKDINLGRFIDILDAARAYDYAAIKYFGEFALTNESLGLLL